MKIAIPLADGKLASHFGHCKEFALIDIDEEKNEINNKEVLVPPPHEPGVLPKWLSELQANVVIAGGMGHRAVSLFNEAGIRVITGAPAEEPEEIVRQYMNNTLTTGENLCDH
ncbi:NifB/NifX family molybdenum-iron cluster-binding protein [Desulfococcaceae bacterium HSG8]|nr:NifB/NifX family molybdenum-iron cluster-binding protein [Desulfococcaceae bacterium HSG8]